MTLLVGVPGCTGSDDTALGSISLNLVGQAPSGAVYRLRDGHITVEGAATAEWTTEAAPDQTAISTDVPVGDYIAFLHDGWRLERIEGRAAVPVSAQLVSGNPMAFTVTAMQRTAVPLRFRVDGGEVDLTQGYDIVVTVEEPHLATMAVVNFDPGVLPSIAFFAAHAQGDVAPLRRIIGGSTELSAPQGIALAGSELAVRSDSVQTFGSGSVAFFPVTASGDVLPDRLLHNAHGVDTPSNIAVYQGELYVLENIGTCSPHKIAVFPLTATGNQQPARTMILAGEQCGSEVAALTVAGGEVFVGGVRGRIDVYPATGSGDVTPSRTIIDAFDDTSHCFDSVLVRGDELFVSDECGRAIRVLPATASGPTVPLRVIAGPSTGLSLPTKMALFEDELYVCDFNDSVRVFPAGASGDAAPTRVLAGPHTTLSIPSGVVVF